MIQRALFLLLSATLLGGPLAAQELSLEQVLQSHYAAIGGLDNWKALKSMKMTGRMTVGPGMEAPFTVTAMQPTKMRIEFTFQGMTGVQAFDGETGWMIMPFMGNTEPEPMPAEDVKNMSEEADIAGPLVSYEEKGHTLELVGKSDIEGTPAYKLKVTLKTGDVRYYYLDAEFYVTLRIEGKRTVQGTEAEFETILSDYKEVGGLLLPHAIDSRIKGMATGQVLTVDSLELNVPVDEGIFAMPKKKEGPK